MAKFGRTLRTVFIAFTVFTTVLVVGTTPASALPAPVLAVYVPIPEDDIQAALTSMAATSGLGIGNNVQTIISITVAAEGGFLYYDHWEDGYETDIANPTQGTTEVWGDNNPANGIPPGYATDVIGSGSVIVLDNGGTITTPRSSAVRRYDGRDKVASNRGFALTRAGWEAAYGTLHAGAIAAYDTSRFGTSFEFPIGQDVGTNQEFEYTSLSVMAGTDNTDVVIDIDGDGTIDRTVTLDEGETTFVNGGIQSSGTMRTTKPVQAALLTGDVGATFEGRWFELFPMELISDNYVAAAGTTEAGNEPVIYLYNPATFDIVVDVQNSLGTTQIDVPAKTAVSYLMPLGSGGSFTSVGAPFFALSATGAQATGAGGTANSSENDWGYTMVPEALLTAGVVVGWGPGSWDATTGLPTQNMSPVWVAALADTTLNVDYDSDGTVDQTIPVLAFESTAIYDAGDNDMTGVSIFTTDGTRLSAAWGQDPATASPGAPALDLGSAVVPATAVIVNKDFTLADDVGGDGAINPGDTVRFSISVFDASALSLTQIYTVDNLAAEFDYVEDSTTLDGVSIQDNPTGTPFPLDGVGHYIPTMLPGASRTYEFDARVTGAWPLTAIGTTNRAVTTALEGTGVDTVGIPVELEDLFITKTGPTAPVSIGDTVTYAIEVSNLGGGIQSGVSITDVLPSELDLVSASLTAPSNGASGFAFDGTDTSSFANDDGTIPWAGSWIEVDNQGSGPTNGSVRMYTSGGADNGGYFRMRQSNNSMRRAIDTTAYTAGTLSLAYSRRSMESNDVVTLEASSDGGASWTALTTFQGPANDSGYLDYSVDITPFVGGQFQLRISSDNQMNNNDAVYFSDIRVDLSNRDPVTSDAGSGPVFASGLTLVVGESATLEIVATVNASAAGLPFFDNVASTSSTTDGPAEAPARVDLAPASIGDVVFADNDGSGTQDAGEPGLPGVTLELLDGSSGSVLATTQTAADGSYLFDGLLAGTYDVRVVESSLPTNTTTQTADPDAVLDSSGTASVAVGESVTSIDFGFQPRGSIGDTIFRDNNGNGSQNGAGEIGLANVTVELLEAGGAVVASTQTTADGGYLFDDLVAGTYTVRVDASTLPLNATTPTADPDTTLDGQSSITIAAGEDVTTADFGFQPLGVIGDTVFSDNDGDGIQDAGEPGLDGIGLELLNNVGTVIAATTTSSGGAYAFTGLAAGSYTVRVVAATLPVNTAGQTADPDATVDGQTTLTLSAGGVRLDADFGYQLLGSIGDTVFSDLDGNGTQGAGEPGLSGVTVELLDGVGVVVATDITDAAGTYGFADLEAGDYTVRIGSGLAAGSTATADRDGTLDDETALTLTAGEDVVDADFGYAPPVPASLGDTIFNDDNNNGIQDAGEPGLAGVTVELLDGSGTVLASAVTDASGVYGFGGLAAGSYTVRVDTSTLPFSSFSLTADPEGAPDDQATTTVDFGDSVLTLDFGYLFYGSIGDTVFSDLDGDGVQDVGEPGLAGVDVQVLDSSGNTVFATETTDASGNYLFSGVPSGTYVVRVITSTLPANTSTQTFDLDGTLDGETTFVFSGGEDRADVDFGYQPLGSIGDTVYSDTDGDGTQDAGEPGLSGVTVELLDGSGTTVASDVTDGSGVYGFAGLPAGDYTVRIANGVAPGSTATADLDGTLDGETVLTLAAGEDVVDADFGYAPPAPASIGDTVFADYDGDGLQGVGEPGLSGVTVELLDGAGTAVGSDVTDGSGGYGFTGLTAGTYTVRVDASTLPADTTTQTADRDAILDGETTVTVSFGQNLATADFGYQPLGSIGDTVFSDVNGSGAQGLGEPGLSGITVELLDGSGTVVASDTTDAAGQYGFTGLAAGDYTVRVDASTLPADTTTQTADRDSTLDGETTLTLAAGEDVTDADFGYQPLGSIGDTVFSDTDGNGTQDAGELGLAGVTVELLDASATVVATDTTDASGVYGFAGLAAGDYTVRIGAGVPAGSTQTADLDGALDGETTVTLAAGEDVVDANFGYAPPAPASIGDTVFSDTDGNGSQGVGEPGLAGVTVELLDGAGTVVGSDVTAADGSYSFPGLSAGTFTVRVDASTLPADTTTQTADRDATLDGETTVTVTFGQNLTTADFGYQPLGSIGDTVFSDTDGNGTQGVGEPGLSGVTVELLDGAGTVVGSDVTDASGVYGFAGLAAGDYTVRIGAGVPAGSTQTADRDGTLDGETTLTLAAGEDVVDADSGFQPAPLLGSIGDTIYMDIDGNGVFDATDAGLAGAVVELVDGSGTVVASDVSDSVGDYGFADLPAGVYTVRVAGGLAPGSTQTEDPDGTLDDETTLTLAAGEDVVDADFGYAPPAPASIGDTVFSDTDGNGSQGVGEFGLSGVTVELLDAAGTVIASDTTSATGAYGFADLAAGDYTVRVDASTLPADTTTQTADRDATLDGQTSVTLSVGEDVTDADFGFQPLGSIGDLVFADDDGNGVRDAGEPGLSGVTVELLDAAGTVVASDVTDAVGVYGFTGLPAGDYSVRVASGVPAGSTQTADRDGTLDDETTLTLASGEDVVDADFGYEPAPLLGSIGDTVFSDTDGNGVQDGGESGIPGVTVELLDGAGTVVASDVTDGVGVYGFTGLAAGDFTVRVDASTLPADTTTQTADRDATLDGQTSVTLSAGADVLDADFGFQPLGSIGDTVFSDTDGNGVQDGGESGIPGVTVELLDAAGTVIASDTTSATGTYGFADLAAGDYTVRVGTGVPAGSTQTADRDGTLDDETTVSLAAGEDVVDADFGYEPAPLLGSIGDTVFSDTDGNGVRDSGELGLSGVTVELLDGAGTVVASDVTDAVGVYGFTGLAAGDFTVRVDASTLPADTTTQTADPDATVDGRTTITLAAGEDVTDADFGFQPLGSIGDLVFADDDGDGVRDAGEPGLSGVTVELLDAAGTVVASDVTDAVGVYGFTGLVAGDYTVRVASGVPTGSTQTADRDGTLDNETTLTLAAGADVLDADFGFQPLGSIGDTVFSDTDGNGVQDGGESGIPGVTVELLDAAGTVIASDTTSATGTYGFADLAAGDYTVRVGTGVPAGSTQTADRDGTLDDETTLTLASGEDVVDADFGYAPAPLLGSIGDTVFSDTDGNGSQGAGEPGLSGVTVELLDGAGTVVASDVTDAVGVYGFTDLPAGDYTVRVDASTLPAGSTQTADRDGTLDDETSLTLAAGEDVVDADFGYAPPVPASIGDTVFSDNDGNGTQDAGEPGLAGVTVELLDGAGTVITSAVTAADGSYSFAGLVAGTYTVRIDASTLPTNTTTQTADRDATLDGETTVTVTFGQNLTTADFGYQPLGTIGDTVFADDDGDGVQDAGEPGLSGVTVELLDAAGTVVASDVTNAVGVYGFTGLVAGDYTVRVASGVPAGSTQTADRDGTLDDETTLTLVAGEDVVDVDFGYEPAPLLGSIGDLVFSDTDGDGVQDAGELGLSGVTVELLDGAGTVIASDTTDAVGVYGFTGLVAGDYTVRVASGVPAGSTQTADRDGALDDETTLTLVAGEDVGDVDFGYEPAPLLGSIGDTVFADDDGNGVQDGGESGIPGVTVELLDSAGSVVASTISSLLGEYSFTGLLAGDYTVRIDTSTLPADTTTQTADPDATVDGRTTITLAAGEDVTDADFGFQPLGSIGDLVFADDDGDGVRDAGEPGLSGVTVELLDGAGTVVASDTTSASGTYGFVGLPAGDYTVRIDTSTLPADTTTQTADPDATVDGRTTITLAAGADITTADFGFQPLGTIGDTVFTDVDGNGVFDGADTGLPGVTVELLDGAGAAISSDVTDASGLYGFDALPAGDYSVRIDTTTVPAGSTQTADRDGTLDDQTSLTLVAGADVVTADFGYLPAPPVSAIGDTVFADLDGNGAQDAGEPGVPGVTVELLDAAGTVISSEVTDGSGTYGFAGLLSGDYTVRIDVSTLPANTSTQTSDPDATLDAETTITVVGGTDDTTIDFGFQPLGTIGDLVYSDENGDGVRDAAEPGLANVAVELLDGAGTVVATDTTDVSGLYGFSGLATGTYTVRIDGMTLPAGVTQTADRDATLDGTTSLTLGAAEDITDADFGYEPPAPLGSIGDRVFADLDGNGVDDAEPGIAGVTVELLDGAGTVVAAAITDPTGAWAIGGLPAATYTVRVDASTLPADTTTATADRDGTADGQTSIVLAPGALVTDADFGFQPLGTIGDTIFSDDDGNGVQDAGEPGLGNVDVQLVDGAGSVVATETTDPAGAYSFADVPAGPWTVQVDASTLPTDTTTVTADPDAVDDGVTAFVLGAGEDRTDVDFGFQPLGSVSTSVWEDVDGDGVRDAGEAPLVSVDVELLDAAGTVIATETTDAGGLVTFIGLPAGDYTTRIVVGSLPANTTTVTGDPDATLDGRTAFTLAPGEDRSGDEFGYQPLATLGDLVYVDVDGNGVFDGTDTGLAGVTVELLDATGTVVATIQTDGAGGYAFTAVPATTHTVRIDTTTLPANVSTQTADPDATLDDQTTVTPTPGEVVVDLDFGYEPDPTTGTIVVSVFADVDGNGTLDGVDADLAGVTVDLLDGAGTVVATGVTAADGTFSFSGVLAGDYTTRVDASTLPADTTLPTADPDATVDGQTTLTLLPGATDATSVFGFQPLGSVSTSVWEDVDGDGVRDAGEAPLVSVDVELLDAAGTVIATETTDAGGLVTFAGLPAGDYTTRIVVGSLPANTTTVTGDPDATLDGRTAFTLAPGEDRSGDEFGYQPLADISGTVFGDLDGDGVVDAGETGIGGVTVELLDGSGTVVLTTGTTPDGSFAFSSLPDADYTVRVDVSTIPGAMVQTADPDATLDHRTTATVVGSTDVNGLEFGYQTPPPAPGTITSTIWLDTDGDGVVDPGEQGIPGIRVELVDASGAVVATVTTTADGSYTFTGVVPGDYTIHVDETTLPTGVSTRTADPDGTLDATTPVTVTAGTPTTLQPFGYQPDPTATGAIDGVIFHDVDRDGVRGGSEPVMTQVTVILRDASGTEIARAETDANGFYLFDDLPLGTYVVEVVPPVGFTITTQTTGPNGSVIDANGRVVVAVTTAGTVETAFGGLQLLSSQTTGTTTTQPTTTTTQSSTTTTVQAGTGPLAHTGTSTLLLVGAGLGLVAAGWFFLIASRRREEEADAA